MTVTEGRGERGEGRAFFCALFSLFCLLSFILWASTSAWACPSCKEAISSSGDPAFGLKLTKGYARSIALMMATPYVVFAGITLLIVRQTRRSRPR